jgi:hypothetical protein
MLESNRLYLYGGAYTTADDARADLRHLVLFPPSILIGAAAGTAAGAMANNTNKRLSRSDAKGLAELLAPGESGVLVVAEDIEAIYSSALLQRAPRQQAVEIDADADAVEEALRAAQSE